MPRVLDLFAQIHPQINIEGHVESTRTFSKWFWEGDIGIAIGGVNIQEELEKNIRVEEFVQENLMLIELKLHPFALKGKNINKADLYHLRFITLNLD